MSKLTEKIPFQIIFLAYFKKEPQLRQGLSMQTSLSTLPSDNLIQVFSQLDLKTLKTTSFVSKSMRDIANQFIKPYVEAKLLISFFVFRDLTRCKYHPDEAEYINKFLDYCNTNKLDYQKQEKNFTALQKIKNGFTSKEKKISFSPTTILLDLERLIEKKLQEHKDKFLIIDLPKHILSNKFYLNALKDLKQRNGAIFTFSPNLIKELGSIATAPEKSNIMIPHSACERPEFIQAIEEIFPKCYSSMVILFIPSIWDKRNLEFSPLEAMQNALMKKSHLSIVTINFSITDKDAEILAQLITSHPSFHYLALKDEPLITNAGLKIIAVALAKRQSIFAFTMYGYAENLNSGIQLIESAAKANSKIRLAIDQKTKIGAPLKRTWTGTDPQEITALTKDILR